MLLPIAGKTGIWMWFKANQKWIAENLCENKNNEKADLCKGCCYLDKQLKKVVEPSSENNDQKNRKLIQSSEDWVYINNKEIHSIIYLNDRFVGLFIELKINSTFIKDLAPPPKSV